MGWMRSIAAIALALAVTGGGEAAQPSTTAIEAEGQGVLTDDTVSFSKRAAWTDRVECALRAEHREEAAGRLALLWMQDRHVTSLRS